MECLTSKYAAMKLLSFYIHIKNSAFTKLTRSPVRMEEFLL